jgi:TrmH family RNA methyltransferase
LPAPAEFDRLFVVLVATRNPLNIGAAARAMSNFGFLQLRVVNPYDPAFREARSAVGASELLARTQEFKTVAEAVADCTLVVGTTAVGRREVRHQVRPLQDGAQVIRKELASGRVAVLFGSEKFGLSNDDLSHCHWLMRIPTREEHRSMNLGQAVAVCLYELARLAQPVRKPEIHKMATSGDIDRIAELMLDALDAAGSLKSRSAASTHEKFRRLIRRHNLSAADAKFWLGMLRQVVWKLRAAEESTRKSESR